MERVVQTSRRLGGLLCPTLVGAHTTDERAELLTAVSFSRLGLDATSSSQVVERLARFPSVMASQARTLLSLAKPRPISCATSLHLARSRCRTSGRKSLRRWIAGPLRPFQSHRTLN